MTRNTYYNIFLRTILRLTLAVLLCLTCISAKASGQPEFLQEVHVDTDQTAVRYGG